jgi:hypothetical protein
VSTSLMLNVFETVRLARGEKKRLVSEEVELLQALGQYTVAEAPRRVSAALDLCNKVRSLVDGFGGSKTPRVFPGVLHSVKRVRTGTVQF